MENMVTLTQGMIKCDFEGAKEKIRERLEEYEGAVFTEESKTIAKKEVAKLRKEKTAFSDRVKEVKAEYMKPYLEFEKSAKEMIALYDQPINLINGQVQEFEEKRRMEKIELIQNISSEELSGVSDIISLEKVYNKKWENATYKEKDIREELRDYASKAAAAVQAIKAMQSPDESEALSVYSRTLDLTQAITLINDRAQVRADALKREQERKAREEEERIRREEREKIEAERRKQEEIEAVKRQAEEEKEKAVERAKESAIESIIPEFSGESNLYEYRISLTQDAKEKLEMYMDSVGIEWEMVE